MPWGAPTPPAPAASEPATASAPPPDEVAPAPPRLEPPTRVERLRTAIGPDRFDLIRIAAVVTLVGVAIGAVQLRVRSDRPAPVGTRVESRAPASASPTRSPTLRTGPTNPDEPTFRAVYPVPTAPQLQGKGIARAPEPECPGSGQRVSMFALGEAPTVDVESLAAYFRATYGLPITVLPSVPLAGIEEYQGRVVSQERGQINGDQMIEVLKARFPVSATDGRVTMIAVTPHDLYREFSDTPYLYSVRGSTRPARFTIVSNARMDDRGWGEAANPEALIARTRKLVSREVGQFHFGIPESPEPTSLTHNTFGSCAGVDRAADRLDQSKATLRPLPPIPPP